MEEKIVAYFHGDEPSPTYSYRRKEDMITMIKKALPDATFQIVPPQIRKKNELSKHFTAPCPALISGLTALQRNLLVQQRTFATATKAIHFARIYQRPTDFAFFLVDYDLPADEEESLTNVRNMLISCASNQLSKTLPAFLLEHHDALTETLRITNPTLQLREIIQYIFSRINIQGQWIGKGANRSPAFAVRMPTPTLLNDKHSQWIELLKSATYWSSSGIARPQDTLNCNGCKAIDHSSTACPFSTIPGFPSYYSELIRNRAPQPSNSTGELSQPTAGPSLQNLIPEQSKPNDRGNRGGRGRGRGNGGRGRGGRS
ncbi:hypothetical protein CVT24_011682 [Panaeolus cyanescens]|uniref:Uncharacterized protein n=1 Tax=Panaeolus cyanescens TaxID=181874 RepID=A0A409X9V4_9AGAR|nr:hypothetical protein CVT24_011682 [Panaeolus cyanescens]